MIFKLLCLLLDEDHLANRTLDSRLSRLDGHTALSELGARAVRFGRLLILCGARAEKGGERRTGTGMS